MIVGLGRSFPKITSFQSRARVALVGKRYRFIAHTRELFREEQAETLHVGEALALARMYVLQGHAPER